MKNLVGCVVQLMYLALGVFQFIAFIDGVSYILNIRNLFVYIIAFIISYIPLVGTVCGMIGAMYAWHWSWVKAGLLFFGPFLFISTLTIVAGGIGSISQRLKKR